MRNIIFSLGLAGVFLASYLVVDLAIRTVDAATARQIAEGAMEW